MYREEVMSSRDRDRGRRVTGLPPRSAPTSPAVHRRLGPSTLIAHHSPTIPRRYPRHGRAWSPSSDSDSSEDKTYLMRRFLEPQGQEPILERSRSVSPLPYSMRPKSPYYEAAIGKKGTIERYDSDPRAHPPEVVSPEETEFEPLPGPGHITVRRSPCRSPGLRGRKMEEDVLRQGRDRGPGRKDPLAHQLSFSSESSVGEAVFGEIKRVPVPAPAGIFSGGGIVTTATSVSPCPSPSMFESTKPTSQDNVDYTKAAKERAKATLDLPPGGLTVEPVPSPCPSPIIFRDIKEEEEEEGEGSPQGRRSQSKSPRPRQRPDESRQPGHVSSTELFLTTGDTPPQTPTKPQPVVILREVPAIQVLGGSPEKSELDHSPESAFREPMKDQVSLERARDRRRMRRGQSPMDVDSSSTQGPESITVGFRPISPTTSTSPALVGSPSTLTASLGGAAVVRPSAFADASLRDTFPASQESRVQETKVLIVNLLRMMF